MYIDLKSQVCPCYLATVVETLAMFLDRRGMDLLSPTYLSKRSKIPSTIAPMRGRY
jgi:hypothetical protein